MLTFVLSFALALPGDDVKTPPQASPGVVDGAQLFLGKCAQCHRIGELGNDFGPNLSDAGIRLTREQIKESILEPSKTIAKGYEFTELTLMDGNKPAGILAPQSAGQYILKQPGGVVYRFDKSTVKKVTPVPVSGMMLFTDKLTPEQIDAAADYLLAQRTLVPHEEVKEIPQVDARSGPTFVLYLAAASLLVFGFILLRGQRRKT